MSGRTQLHLWARAFSILLFIALIIPTRPAAADKPAPLFQNDARAVRASGPSRATPSGEVRPASADLVLDGGFELNLTDPYTANPYWGEDDALGYEHLCSTGYCTGNQYHQPQVGVGWAWLGGRPEAGYWSEIWQTVPFPGCGAATALQFYLMMSAQSGAGANDSLNVYLDNVLIYTVSATQTSSFSTYHLVSIDVSGFADGASHTIDFFSLTSDQVVNFNIDSVSLIYSGGACPISGNTSAGGVALWYLDGAWKNVKSDAAGNYSLPVSWGWGGSVTPLKPGFTFSPAVVPYTDVTGAVTGQNYTYLHTFADVPVAGKEWMEPWILSFYGNGVTSGCNPSPLSYCPEANVTRAEMAVFLLRAKHGASYTPPAATGIFGDVPVTGKEWMQPWIEQFYREGITSGCGGGNYCPEDNVTRAEMAVFIIRAIHPAGYVPPAAANPFADVPVIGKEWMAPWIIDFYNHGITTGCGSGNFCPENNVTRAEMAVFIDRAYGFYP